jgi:hypothetical protein
VTNDVDASNGIIHGINRVLFPPPIFTKEQAIWDAVAFNESVSQADCLRDTRRVSDAEDICIHIQNKIKRKTVWQPGYHV